MLGNLAHNPGLCKNPIGVVFLVSTLVSPFVYGSFPVDSIEVIDGDSLRLALTDREVTVHLWGIDAPEIGQKWGEDAGAHLREIIGDGPIEVELDDSIEAEITARVSAAGSDLSAAMVEAGYAWLPEDGQTSQDFATLLFISRSSGRGMWVDDPDTLLHPARWIVESKPLPTPTPAPTPLPDPLSRYAKEIAVAGAEDGEVVIDDIPTRTVRRRETSALRNSLSRLSWQKREFNRMVERKARECDTEQPKVSNPNGEGTYWSEAEQRWVSEAPVVEPAACDRYRSAITKLRNEISAKKTKAVNQARRFGLSEQFIASEIRKNHLEEF